MMSQSGSEFSHICFSVDDINRSRTFYVEALGFTATEYYEFDEAPNKLMELDERVAFHTQFLTLGSTRLELMCFREPARIPPVKRSPMFHCGFTHIAIRVPDLDATLGRVRKHAGAVLHDTRTRLPMDGYECEMAYCTDPDGNRIELLWMPAEVNMAT